MFADENASLMFTDCSEVDSLGSWYEFVNFGAVIDSGLVGVPREQKMLEGHLPSVIYHHVYSYTKKRGATKARREEGGNDV